MVAEDHERTVQVQDLEKMRDVVKKAVDFHKYRDRMNATLHMTPVRFSPLTSSLETVLDRLDALASGIRDAEEDSEETA